MKAYMSVPGARVVDMFTGSRRQFTSFDRTACEAEQEARRIIGETEPEISDEAHTLPLGLLHFAGPRSGYGAGFALAEALAAFCDDEQGC